MEEEALRKCLLLAAVLFVSALLHWPVLAPGALAYCGPEEREPTIIERPVANLLARYHAALASCGLSDDTLALLGVVLPILVSNLLLFVLPNARMLSDPGTLFFPWRLPTAARRGAAGLAAEVLRPAWRTLFLRALDAFVLGRPLGALALAAAAAAAQNSLSVVVAPFLVDALASLTRAAPRDEGGVLGGALTRHTMAPLGVVAAAFAAQALIFGAPDVVAHTSAVHCGLVTVWPLDALAPVQQVWRTAVALAAAFVAALNLCFCPEGAKHSAELKLLTVVACALLSVQLLGTGGDELVLACCALILLIERDVESAIGSALPGAAFRPRAVLQLISSRSDLVAMRLNIEAAEAARHVRMNLFHVLVLEFLRSWLEMGSADGAEALFVGLALPALFIGLHATRVFLGRPRAPSPSGSTNSEGDDDSTISSALSDSADTDSLDATQPRPPAPPGIPRVVWNSNFEQIVRLLPIQRAPRIVYEVFAAIALVLCALMFLTLGIVPALSLGAHVLRFIFFVSYRVFHAFQLAMLLHRSIRTSACVRDE